jgi:hypothetical protein
MSELRSLGGFEALEGFWLGLLLREGLRVLVERLSLLPVLRFEGLAVLRWVVLEVEFCRELVCFLLRLEFFREWGRDSSSSSSSFNSFSLLVLF